MTQCITKKVNLRRLVSLICKPTKQKSQILPPNRAKISAPSAQQGMKSPIYLMNLRRWSNPAVSPYRVVGPLWRHWSAEHKRYRSQQDLHKPIHCHPKYPLSLWKQKCIHQSLVTFSSWSRTRSSVSQEQQTILSACTVFLEQFKLRFFFFPERDAEPKVVQAIPWSPLEPLFSSLSVQMFKRSNTRSQVYWRRTVTSGITRIQKVNHDHQWLLPTKKSVLSVFRLERSPISMHRFLLHRNKHQVVDYLQQRPSWKSRLTCGGIQRKRRKFPCWVVARFWDEHFSRNRRSILCRSTHQRIELARSVISNTKWRMFIFAKLCFTGWLLFRKLAKKDQDGKFVLHCRVSFLFLSFFLSLSLSLSLSGSNWPSLSFLVAKDQGNHFWGYFCWIFALFMTIFSLLVRIVLFRLQHSVAHLTKKLYVRIPADLLAWPRTGEKYKKSAFQLVVMRKKLIASQRKMCQINGSR